MEVVVGPVRVSRHALVALVQRHVVEAVPLEEHAAAGHVDLLDDPVVDLAVGRTTDGREVPACLVVGGDQRSTLRGEHERVLVRVVAVAGAHVRDHVVRGVGDDSLALAVPRAGDAPSLPPGQNRASPVALDAYVAGYLARWERPEPDGPAAIVDDQRAALLSRAGGQVLGAQEDKARGEPGGAIQDRDRGGPQVANTVGGRPGGGQARRWRGRIQSFPSVRW